MCFLFLRTTPEKRLKSTNGLPFGCPLGEFIKKEELSNIHHAASPGAIMRCRLSEVRDDNMSRPLQLPPPQYMDPGKGDVMTRMHEIVEHRALAGSELHWQEMYEKWQSGPELRDDVLDHILVNAPCRVSVLLSIPPSQIVNLHLSSKALGAVKKDFEGCSDALR